MVKGASQALGMVAVAEDLGTTLDEPIQLNTDASAAIGIGSRLGLGKVRHIEVNQLWLQEKVHSGRVTLKKVKTEENIADALTKAVDGATLMKHVEMSNAEARTDRHPLAPELDEEERMGEELREEEDDEEENKET